MTGIGTGKMTKSNVKLLNCQSWMIEILLHYATMN